MNYFKVTYTHQESEVALYIMIIYWHGWSLIPAWISHYIRYKARDEITYPFPNFNADMWCNPTYYWACDLPIMMELKLIHVNKSFPSRLLLLSTDFIPNLVLATNRMCSTAIICSSFIEINTQNLTCQKLTIAECYVFRSFFIWLD